MVQIIGKVLKSSTTSGVVSSQLHDYKKCQFQKLGHKLLKKLWPLICAFKGYIMFKW